jgi:hypothetical protein
MSLILGILDSGGAAASTSSYESIASATGTGSSGTITFSSIPAIYASLQIRINGKGAANYNGSEFVLVTANSDTGSNYAYHALSGYGTGTQAYGYASQTSMALGDILQSGASVTSMQSGVIIDVHDYANTSKYKTFRSFSGSDRNGGGAATLFSGLWMSTSAITSISLVNNTANWTTATSISLYGIKGA